MSNNIYNILGKLKGITDTAALTPETPAETVYESVEARGSITEAVRSLEAKFKTFKESFEEQINEYSSEEHDQAMADFKARGGKVQQVPAGSAKNPISTASRHIGGRSEIAGGKKAGKASQAVSDKAIVDLHEEQCGLSDATAKGLLDGSIDLYSAQGYGEGVSQQEQQCLQDMYDDVAREHSLHADDDFEQIHQHMLDRIEQDYSVVDESNDTDDNVDYEEFYKNQPADSEVTDLDNYKFADADTDASIAPVSAKQAAADKRRRLQDLADRRAEKDDWFSGKDKTSNVRTHHATHQDVSDIDESSARIGDTVECPTGVTGKIIADLGNKWLVKDLHAETEDDELEFNKSDCLAEVAPPGAKAERMVKHIKKGYADDGKLTKKEKGIAYATAWKAHNKGQVEEGVSFGDPIKNSAPNMKKAKLSKLKESKVMEETDYFYEKVGKALADKNSMLDTASSEFEAEVRKEMVAQGIAPNRARNILLMDEDFLGDVATSYGHYCKVYDDEVGDDLNQLSIPAPTNDAPVTQELDEIARLAGLAPRVSANDVDMDIDNPDEFNRDLSGDDVDADLYVDEVAIIDEEAEIAEAASRKDFRMVANLLKNIPDSVKRRELAKHHADIFKQQNPRFSHDKFYAAADALEEGNEFSGALAAAKASGAKEFEVAGTRYTVKEDVNLNISANGDQDVINLIAKLAGIPGMELSTPDGQRILQNPLRQIAQELPQDAETAIAQGVIEPVEVEVDEERDIEYSNTPNEKISGVDAAIPSGTDLHRAKKSYSDKPYRGDNPMAVEEDALWESYETMLNKVKE